jgi:hypothetical protein
LVITRATELASNQAFADRLRVGFTLQPFNHIGQRTPVARREYVLPAVVVVVPGPTRESSSGALNAHCPVDFCKRPIVVVPIELTIFLIRLIIQEQVLVSIVIKVEPRDPFAVTGIAVHTREFRHILEGTVPSVTIETTGLFLAADKQIQPALS